MRFQEKVYRRAASYIANKYFFYGKRIKLLRSGTKGSAFLVDNGKKVLKITDDVDEALRAERIRGKHFKNLINYYDIRRIKSSNDMINGKYCLLMDKLPKVLTDDRDIEDIFKRYDNMYDIAWSRNNMPGYEIANTNSLRKFIKKELSEKKFYDVLSDDYKVIAERMWFDLIQIRKQLKKCGIVTNDITSGNLGFDKMGNLVFYDMGYPGSGRKDLRPNKEVQVQFDDPKIPVAPKFKMKKLKQITRQDGTTAVVERFNNFIVFEKIEVEI
jgi:hypothetical protein